jgi:hypothetical protein
VRRPAVLISIALLAGALLVRRRRRRAASSALGDRRPAPPLGRPAAGTRFISVPWELVTAPADEPSLTIRYRGDEHMELDRVDAQETPTQVFVTVLMRWRPPAGGWVALEREHDAVVPLGHPLGERELVHAPADDPRLYP